MGNPRLCAIEGGAHACAAEEDLERIFHSLPRRRKRRDEKREWKMTVKSTPTYPE